MRPNTVPTSTAPVAATIGTTIRFRESPDSLAALRLLDSPTSSYATEHTRSRSIALNMVNRGLVVKAEAF